MQDIRFSKQRMESYESMHRRVRSLKAQKSEFGDQADDTILEHLI